MTHEENERLFQVYAAQLAQWKRDLLLHAQRSLALKQRGWKEDFQHYDSIDDLIEAAR